MDSGGLRTELKRSLNHTQRDGRLVLKAPSEPSATAAATAAFTALGELRDLTWESYDPSQDEETLG